MVFKTRCELAPRTFVRPRSTSTAARASVSAEPLAGLVRPVMIAGVTMDAARSRGAVACASPGTAGAGGAPG